MHENKCAEEEIGIEMDRQRRAGASKAGRAEKNASNFCKMCDCYYAVNWGTHKVSLGHRVRQTLDYIVLLLTSPVKMMFS